MGITCFGLREGARSLLGWDPGLARSREVFQPQELGLTLTCQELAPLWFPHPHTAPGKAGMDLLVLCQRDSLFQQSWFEGWEIPSPGNPRKATVLEPNVVVHPKYCQGEDVWLMLIFWGSPDRGRMPVGESLQNPLTVGPGLGLWAQTGWLTCPGIYKALEVSKVFYCRASAKRGFGLWTGSTELSCRWRKGQGGVLGHGPLEPAMCF